MVVTSTRSPLLAQTQPANASTSGTHTSAALRSRLIFPRQHYQVIVNQFRPKTASIKDQLWRRVKGFVLSVWVTGYINPEAPSPVENEQPDDGERSPNGSVKGGPKGQECSFQWPPLLPMYIKTWFYECFSDAMTLGPGFLLLLERKRTQTTRLNLLMTSNALCVWFLETAVVYYVSENVQCYNETSGYEIWKYYF